MLGFLASQVREHCKCGSCSIVIPAGREVELRRIRADVPWKWDDDLSDWDLATLKKAGWSADQVRQHVETLRAMISALTQFDSGEPGSDYVSPDRGADVDG
jgi:hypothetical protein